MSIIAKSVIIDIADNHGNIGYMGLRSIDFFLADVLLGITTEFTAYSTTRYSDTYLPSYVFNTSLSKIGNVGSVSWISADGIASNQRVIIVFDTTAEFDKIVVNNMHNSGTLTDGGAQNVVITSSTDAITDTTYNATITNPTILFDGIFLEHIASDIEDPQTILLDGIAQTPSGVTDFIAPLVFVDGAGYFYSGSTNIKSTVDLDGYGIVTAFAWSNISPDIASVAGVCVNMILGHGDVKPKLSKIHGNYSAVGDIEAHMTIDSYGMVSIIGDGALDVRLPTMDGTGQLSIITNVNYAIKPPVIVATGVGYPTGYVTITAPRSLISTYGHLQIDGECNIIGKLPMLFCHANQPDDYTIIRHTREGVCH